MFFMAFLIIIALLLLHWQWERKFDYWKRKGFPHIAGSFPFGTSRDLALYLRYQGHVLQDLSKKLSPNPYGGIYIWNHPFLIVNDPEIIRTVLSKEFQHFRDRGRFEIKSSVPISKHLFSLGGDLWKALRTKLTPAFTSGRIKNMYSLLETCALELDETLKRIMQNGDSVDIKNVTSCFTLDVISSYGFGLESNSAENDEFRQIFQTIFPPSVSTKIKIKNALCLIFPSLSKMFNLRFIDKKIEDMIMTLVNDTVAHREKNNVRRNDFLDLLIQLKNKGTLENEKNDKSGESSSNEADNLEMTSELLAAQCFVFFAAGFETSSSVQSYTLYELALHQDIQDRVRKEIDEVTERHGGTATYETFQELHYLEQVISEVLRKYPTIPTLTRQCTKPFTLPDRPELTIEQGTKILIPVYALHHNPTYFPEPDKFDPERFSPENKSSIVPYSYLPFGEGPRYCIGKRLGILQSKLGIYTVLRKYKVIPTKETQIPLIFGATTIVLSCKGPIKLMIQPRDDI